MKKVSFFFHAFRTQPRILLCVAVAICVVMLPACYSFRGGTLPSHITTLSIAPVVDRSGFGDPTFRENCTETLILRFRSDNSVQVVDENGDARISSIITRVQDQIAALQSGDVEGTRRITVSVEVEFFDAVKNKMMWKRTFENSDVYNVSDPTEGRRNAVGRAIRRISDDVLLAVVSDW